MAPLVETKEKAEKGLSSLSTPGDRFAYWLNHREERVKTLMFVGFAPPIDE